MECVQVLNISVHAISVSELLLDIDHKLKCDGSDGVLITPNLDHLMKLQKDEDFYLCYQKAEWVVCDSRILYFCSKLLPKSFPEVIQGSTFFTSFYEYYKENEDCKIFLLGAKDGVAQKAKEKINQAVGRQIIVGAYSPSMGFEKNAQENNGIHRMISESGANVVLVGVGAPKQEKWIMEHKHNMPNVKLWMALGATIDFEAGMLKRAPKWMQKFGLEWFYRFMKEPKRLGKRYVGDLLFFLYFFQQLVGVYKNPFAKKK